MAQSPGYANDIFISYAHNDNYEFGGRPGWVDVFEDAKGHGPLANEIW